MAESAVFRPSNPIGPPHLRVIEVDCLKPTTRAKGARTTELDAVLPPGVLTAWDDWE
jgi:hypothetical protein